MKLSDPVGSMVGMLTIAGGIILAVVVLVLFEKFANWVDQRYR